PVGGIGAAGGGFRPPGELASRSVPASPSRRSEATNDTEECSVEMHRPSQVADTVSVHNGPIVGSLAMQVGVGPGPTHDHKGASRGRGIRAGGSNGDVLEQHECSTIIRARVDAGDNQVQWPTTISTTDRLDGIDKASCRAQWGLTAYVVGL